MNRDVQTYAPSVLIKIAFNVEPKYEEMVYLNAKSAIVDGCKILQKNGKPAICSWIPSAHPRHISRNM